MTIEKIFVESQNENIYHSASRELSVTVRWMNTGGLALFGPVGGASYCLGP